MKMSTVATQNTNKEVAEWIRFGMRLAVSTALHPLEYSKVLIQLGYEPTPPVPGKSMFGTPIMALPNIFQYTANIRKTDGFYGCYRGLTPKLVGCVLSMVLSERIADRLGLAAMEDKKDDEPLSREALASFRYLQFKVNLKRDIVLSVSGIVVSHPFHVITVRMMAQFVGRETIYHSILGSIVEIYKNEGIMGFFAGLIPKLVCDVACVLLTSTTVYLLNKYVIKDKIARQYSAGFTQFAFSSILYPFVVVTTCMTVQGSRLMAGQPPFMPAYKNWMDCFSDLSARGELKRGASMFFRPAAGLGKPLTRNTLYVPLPLLAKYN